MKIMINDVAVDLVAVRAHANAAKESQAPQFSAATVLALLDTIDGLAGCASVDSITHRLDGVIRRREADMSSDVDPTLGALYELEGLGLLRRENLGDGVINWYALSTLDGEKLLIVTG
jgi:hypothetical protein